MPNPNKIDTLRYQDIQVPDVGLRTEFKRRVALGQYQEALSLLQDNQLQLKGKAFIAETINKLVEGVSELQDKFNQNVIIYLSDLALEFSTLIDNMRKAGGWVSTKQYEPYNFVVYNQDIYMCIVSAPSGIPITDANYWLKLGLKGEKGNPGVNVTNKYEWNRDTSYTINDLVSYKNNIYVAMKDNKNVSPDDTSAWMLFISYGQGKIYVGATPPSEPVENTVWFQTNNDIDNAPANIPVFGYFKRYAAAGIWEEMYPNTVYELVSNIDSFAYPIFVQTITINTTDWIENKWIYVYPHLTQNSVVDILPVPPLNNTQNILYNSLTVSIEGQNVVLTAIETPTDAITIRIKIIR